MYIGEIIKKYRTEHQLSMQDFANLSGLSKAYIGMLEKIINPATGSPINPSMPKVKAIASAMGITVDDLLPMLDDNQEIILNTLPPSLSIPKEGFIPNYKKVPLLGKTAAGEPIYSEEYFEEYIDVHKKYNIDYCLRVQGDSMIGANIFDGDIVFVRKQSIVENGEIAVVRVNDTVTLKRFYKTDTGVMLQSENPKYPPMSFTPDNTDSFIILGKAIILQTTVK